MRYHFRRIISMPVDVLIQKILGKVKDRAKAFYDYLHSSFGLFVDMPLNSLSSLLGNLSLDILNGNQAWLNHVTQNFVSHQFDILGSGWLRVYHGMHCTGLEGYRYDMACLIKTDREGSWLDGRINSSNLKESQRIWSMLDADYCPIDWHLDFKSGYRWKEDTWYKDIKYGHILGVDVKVPWELSRMQHLSQFAWSYSAAQRGDGGFDAPEIYLREYRNQVLDFISTNPPRWGVNWACTMDVAIRVSNWLVAYDLFRSFGAQFDELFEHIFIRSIYEHGDHIINNLEWSPEIRNNHYLSDIVGLLFVSVYLPCSTETNSWLAFSIQELVKEVQLQFYKDGGNFEASTNYHRFSTELVVYSTALVLGLSDEKRQALKNYDHNVLAGSPKLDPAPLPHYYLPNSKDESPFPEWYFSQLELMAEFIIHITKPNGYIPQIGDNDSGRFLKLSPIYTKMHAGQVKACYFNLTEYAEMPENKNYWLEDLLTHRNLVAAINGLFARADFDAFASSADSFEGRVVEKLSRGLRVSSVHHGSEYINAHNKRVGDLSDWQRCETLFRDCGKFPIITRFSSAGASLRDDLEIIAYPDFGLYLFRSMRLYLAIRCGSIGQNGNGGHAHNDQLSIELDIDGKSIIADPGTYLYTPLPDRRNTYRSVTAHFAPHVEGKEPSDISIGPFIMSGDPCAIVSYFGERGFIGRHTGYGIPVYRCIEVEDDAVVITDFSLGIELSKKVYKKIPISPAYGVIMVSRDLRYGAK